MPTDTSSTQDGAKQGDQRIDQASAEQDQGERSNGDSNDPAGENLEGDGDAGIAEPKAKTNRMRRGAKESGDKESKPTKGKGPKKSGDPNNPDDQTIASSRPEGSSSSNPRALNIPKAGIANVNEAPPPLATGTAAGALGPIRYVLDVLPFLKSTLYFNIGLHTSIPRIEPTNLYHADKTLGYGLGFSIRRLVSVGCDLGLVRPYIVIHCVDRCTGQYIRNKGSSGQVKSVEPMRTIECFLCEQKPDPIWNDDVMLDASYRSSVNSSTIFLFELLDARYSLKSKRKTGAKGRTIKRVAWSFLLPTANDGQKLSVGVGSGWLANKSSKSTKALAAEKNRKKSTPRVKGSAALAGDDGDKDAKPDDAEEAAPETPRGMTTGPSSDTLLGDKESNLSDQYL